MALTTNKRFSTASTADKATFFNDSGQSTVNVEGIVELAEAGDINMNVDSTSISMACYIGKDSGATNGDFDVTYTSGVTLTFSNFPSDVSAITADDIEFIRQINSSGTVVETYSRDDATMSMVGAVITVTGAVFTNTDTFIINTNIPRPSSGGGASADADYKIASWDGTVTYASTTTLTLAGSYPTINYNSQVVYIKVTDDTLHTGDIYFNSQNSVVIEHAGGTLTIVGASTPFAATNDYEVGINAIPVGLDIAGDAQKTLVQNMEAGHYTDPEHIDEDNEGAQNDTKYTRTAFEMSSYKYMSGSYLITADDIHNDVTLRIWATNKDDYSLPDEDTVIADSDMIFDVSEEVLGNAAGITINNGSSGDDFCIDTPSKYYAYIVELKYEEDNTAAPGNASDLYIIRY